LVGSRWRQIARERKFEETEEGEGGLYVQTREKEVIETVKGGQRRGHERSARGKGAGISIQRGRA
jgi:hypothetical protein